MLYVRRTGCILLFLLGLLIFLFAASAVFRPKDNTRETGMEEQSANGILGEPENTIDVLVIGDSESYCSISPMQIWKETGYTAYVCGTSGQKLSYSYTMLDRAFQRQKPKIVILETLSIYRQMGLEDVSSEVLSRKLPVFRYHNRWKSLRVSDFGGMVQASWTNYFKGYLVNKTVDPSGNEPYMGTMDAKSNISLLNRWHVQAIHALCEKNGARLLLLSTPSSINWRYNLHNGVQSLADGLGCEYIDLNLMNDHIKIDWSQDTYDKGDHMNYSGATKVTRFISEYLQKQGNLKDHRGDIAYSKWDEDLKKYEAALL